MLCRDLTLALVLVVNFIDFGGVGVFFGVFMYEMYVFSFGCSAYIRCPFLCCICSSCART